MSELDIPESWAEGKIGSVVGLNPRNEGLTDDLPISFVPMGAVDSKRAIIASHEEKPWGTVKKGYVHFQEGDVLFAKITPCMENKKSAVAEGLKNGFGAGSTEFHVFRAPTSIDRKFLLHFLRTDRFLLEAERNMTGSAGQKRVPKQWIEDQSFPIPPLGEQKRIVAKIESCFSKIDAIEQVLLSAKIRLKRLRESSYLRWFSEYDTSTLSDYITDKPKNGYSPKPSQTPTAIKTLTLGATTSGKFNPEKFKYVAESIPPESHLWLKGGDILIQRSNSLEHVGVSAVYDGAERIFIYPDLMMKIRANENASTEFLHIALMSPVCREYFRRNATGAAGNMPKINQGVVMNAPIPKCDLDEQLKVVKEFRRYSEFVERLLNKLEVMEIASKRLKASVLSSAFSGRLVPQDPAEGTGHDLLQSITKSTASDPTEEAPKPRKKRAKV